RKAVRRLRRANSADHRPANRRDPSGADLRRCPRRLQLHLCRGHLVAETAEPDINPSYRDLAEHYGIAVLPARSRKPKDKAKVEVGVQVVERWILHKPFKKLPGSRRSAFEAIDQPALQALPEHPYVYAEWKKV
ncbi:ISPsy14, transposase, partial [Pseudomonas syringae pv. actinidiae ICMP 19079]